MRSNFASSAALTLAACKLIYAQTSSACNPVEGDECDPNPAFGNSTVTIDFTQGENDYFTFADGTSLEYDGSNGAIFTINSETDAPTIVSKKYLFFGRVDCTIMAAPGQGIVTSFTLQSDDLDEIDWEWIGSDAVQAQSNYFGKGNTTTYDRGAYHPVTDVTTSFHTYSIEWTAESLQWIIDGATVRTLNYADAVGGTQYPQTPMQVRLGTWVAGQEGNSEGTIQWAGGLANMDNAPFKAYYKTCTINDYSNGVGGATKYVYTDNSGDFDSIEVLTDSDDTTTKTSTSTKASATSTKTSEAKTTGSTTIAIPTATGSSNSTTNASSNSSTTSSITPSASTAVISDNGAGAISGVGALFTASFMVLAVFAL